MSDTTTVSGQHVETVAAALARSRVYRFLGTAFLPPEERLTGYLVEAQETAGYLPYDEASLHVAIEEMASTLENTSREGLRTTYRRIFGHTISEECPLYETQYGGGHIFQQTQILGDIAGFYRAFGLEVSDETKERPDHLSIELEFMSTLTHKEAHALAQGWEERVGMCREAQVTFIDEHIGRWVPLFAKRLGERVDGFYRALAGVISIFIDLETRFLQVEPSPLTTLDLRSYAAEPMGCLEDGTEMVDREKSPPSREVY
jgi:DMSO reductase family type II enzyme chaperone